MPTGFSVIRPRKGTAYRGGYVIAFGKIGQVHPGDIRGSLKPASGAAIPATRITGTPSRRHWIMRFGEPGKKVPMGEYTLIIKDAWDNRLWPDIPEVSVVNVVTIGIEYPTDNDQVGSEFIAYGTTTETVTHSATLSPGPAGSRLFSPPENETYWAFEFTEVATGDCTMTVSAGGASQPGPVHVVL